MNSSWTLKSNNIDDLIHASSYETYKNNITANQFAIYTNNSGLGILYIQYSSSVAFVDKPIWAVPASLLNNRYCLGVTQCSAFTYQRTTDTGAYTVFNTSNILYISAPYANANYYASCMFAF